MEIITIKRGFSKTINTKHYGDPKESWIKIESEIEGRCERGDNPQEKSIMLQEAVKDDVLSEMQKIITLIQKKNSPVALTPVNEVMTTLPKL